VGIKGIRALIPINTVSIFADRGLNTGRRVLSRWKHSTALPMARTAICADTPNRSRISA